MIIRIVKYLINFFREKKKMNWYKSSQQLDLINEPRIKNINFNWDKQYNKQKGWDRFLSFSGTPWKHVVKMNVGNPTEEEKKIIINKGLYNEKISPESIEILKNIF